MVKTILSAVLGLAGVLSLAFAVTEAPRARAGSRPTLDPLALRPFPSSRTSQPKTPAPTVPAPAPTPAAVVAKPEPVPAAAADAGVKAAPAVAAAAPRPPPVGDGLLNLRASDTADVYLDGRKIGSSPLNNVRARSGPHKLRFDCYDAAGNAIAGQVKMITVVADEEQDVEYPCPESQ